MKNLIIFAWICTCFTIYAQEVKKAMVVNLREMTEKHPFDMEVIRARLEQMEEFEHLEKEIEAQEYEAQEVDSLAYNLPSTSYTFAPAAKLTSTGDSPAPYFDFDAISSNSSNPPDINAAIGEDFNGTKYLVSVSQGGLMKITDENNNAIMTDASGNPLLYIDYNLLFSTVAHDVIDPQLEFDNIEKRWVMCAMGDFFYSMDPLHINTAEAAIVFAVSATSDPTGNWYIYRIDIDPLCDEAADPSSDNCKIFFDQPWIGYNTNFLVITFESSKDVTGSAGGINSQRITRAAVIPDKYALYNGGIFTNLTYGLDYVMTELTGINGNMTINYGGNIYPKLWGQYFHPCINEDPSFPNDMYFIRPEQVNTSSRLEIKRLDLQGSLVNIVNMPSASSSFTWFDNTYAPINPQIGVINGHITYSTWRTTYNVVYKNGDLWTVQTVMTDNNALNTVRTALLYWQISVDAINNTTTLEQCGMIDDDLNKKTAFLVPSIAVNNYNDVLIGYSFLREDIYPSAAYSVRKNTDPINTMQKPYIYGHGTSIYPSNYNGHFLGDVRWGDYSASFTDTNGKDFWTIQEYSAPPCLGCWNTRTALVSLDVICDPSYTLTNTEYQTIHKYESGDYITSESEIIGNSHILYDAQNSIRLLPGNQGFHVEKGSTFHAYINGCGNTKQKQNENEEVTNIENTIICYPNPSEDILNFGFWETIDSEVIIEIFDAKGQKMNHYRLNPQKETLSISVNKWTSGIYFWKIVYKNVSYTGKFIKS